MFSGKDVPAVGVSIGIERIFAILERDLQRQAAACGTGIRETQTQARAWRVHVHTIMCVIAVCQQAWIDGQKSQAARLHRCWWRHLERTCSWSACAWRATCGQPT